MKRIDRKWNEFADYCVARFGPYCQQKFGVTINREFIAGLPPGAFDELMEATDESNGNPTPPAAP